MVEGLQLFVVLACYFFPIHKPPSSTPIRIPINIPKASRLITIPMINPTMMAVANAIFLRPGRMLILKTLLFVQCNDVREKPVCSRNTCR